MAQLRKPIHDDGPINAGEERLFDYLVTKLPSDYIVIPNLNISIPNGNVSQYYEYDCIVIAPHAVFHIENKDWGGNLQGDDFAWLRNGQEHPNPHKTAGFKTRILAGKIKNLHPDWRFGKIITLVTLSNPSQSKFGLDPQSDCFKQTFTIGNDLYNFITNPQITARTPGMITQVRDRLADMLTGESVKRQIAERTHILNYEIKETLQETEYFREYRCVPVTIKSREYKVREYPLHISGMSPAEMQKLQLKVQNAEMAQQKIGKTPYIVESQCFMNADFTYYYEVSEYIEECSLRSKLKLKTFKQTDKIKIILDVAYALRASHSQSVIHRDIRPENIYITDGGMAQLANFGKSWFVEHSNLNFTVSMGPDATQPYTAPELLGGEVYSGTDIYSLGVIFYELMTGRLPFDSENTFVLAHGGVLSDDMLPSQVANDLPVWMDEVARKTIVQDPELRWEKIDELIDYIESAVRQEQSQSSVQIATKPDASQGKIYYLKDMVPGLKVTPSIVLHEILGKGGFGRVFKAWHEMQSQYLAIKIFERDASVDNAVNEFEALKDLKHPNIVKFVYCDRTSHDLFYTLMELLEGENLHDYARGQLMLPVDQIYQMATQILSALAYMQDKNPPVYHRDVKPNNIVWHKREIYKLIDFNITTTSPDDKSFAGTLPYMAPDLVVSGKKIDWDRSADTFSLGITIYELLTHAYPWAGKQVPNIHMPATDIRTLNDKLSDQMADFVMKSIITDRNKRFRTAQEMLDALMRIGQDGMLKDTRKVITVSSDGTDLKEDPVDYINSLYSQSRHGNRGTRASIKGNAFDALTYTKTKLDKVLIEDVKAQKYKLIIITGNAGDGKTAFIHRIEDAGEQKRQFATNNGSEFYIGNIRFQTNYDGSQDEDEKANDDVLSQFLSPFENLSDYTQASEGRVIAINEGRLVDFLSQHDGFSKLRENIEDYFYQEGHAELLPGLMVINLNLRSVTARTADTPSLLTQQVKKLTDPTLWTKCQGCPIADRCFIKYNVDTFQDASAGNEVINRLEWLIRIIVYKRELHITMRDMRSMIAWMLTRDYNCDEVKQLIRYVQTYHHEDFYWQYYYFNITSQEVAPELADNEFFTLPSLNSNDRLIKMLRDTDVAGVALPAYDRDLYYKKKRPDSYLVFSDRKRSLLATFNEVNSVLPAFQSKDSQNRRMVSLRHKTFVRHQYFEGTFDFKRRLPYRFASKFEAQLRAQNPQELMDTMQILAQAISKSEGYDNSNLNAGYLMLASSNINDPISKSYRRFPLDEFELFVNKTDHLTKYIEYESDSLTFRHRSDKFIMLTVSLDLYEMLQYIREGFSPSINDLRGRFIELQIFKNLLESKTYSEILVTKNNRKFTVIRLDEQKHIIIEPLNA